MAFHTNFESEVVIIGGGAVGLWVRAELARRGVGGVLIQRERAKSQTLASQGIIHGGRRHCLEGRPELAAALEAAPARWLDHLAGERLPDLRKTRLMSPGVWLIPSGGRRWDWLAEPVVDPVSLVANLQAAGDDAGDFPVLTTPAGADGEISFETNGGGDVTDVRVANLSIAPRWVIFAAGVANGPLRRRAGLNNSTVLRPLRVALCDGGSLARNFAAHWIDDGGARLTIQSRAAGGWQLGGRLGEAGVTMSKVDFVNLAISELAALFPGFVGRSPLRWHALKMERAEPFFEPGGRRDGGRLLIEGNTISAWPIKLALVPSLVDSIVSTLATDPSLTGEQSTTEIEHECAFSSDAGGDQCIVENGVG